jgi:signal transduction histidine kinase
MDRTETSVTIDVLIADLQRLVTLDLAPGPDVLARADALRAQLRASEGERDDLSTLYEVSENLTVLFDLEELLDAVIRKATALVGAERGFVVLARPSGEPYIAAARHGASRDPAHASDGFSTTLVNRVLHDRLPVLTTNIQEDDRYELSQSIIIQQIRSVLAVPLVACGEMVGVLYVDTCLSERLFDEPDLRILQAVASQTAMAIRNAKLYQDVMESNARLRAALHELRDTQEQLVQAERLAAVGRLAASVAHELRSPLTHMRNGLYNLDRLLSGGPTCSADIVRRHLTKFDAEIDRQSKIINDLLFFSRNRPRRLVAVDLNALLDETLMRVRMPESIHVRRDLDPGLEPIRADADQVEQVFVNLITNSVQSMREGGTVAVVTRLDASRQDAVVSIIDTGVGISEENRKRLFQPFFTTKDHGVGLGLSVTKSIVDGHRGSIDVDSVEGRGTTFTVRLPLELCG